MAHNSGGSADEAAFLEALKFCLEVKVVASQQSIRRQCSNASASSTSAVGFTPDSAVDISCSTEDVRKTFFLLPKDPPKDRSLRTDGPAQWRLPFAEGCFAGWFNRSSFAASKKRLGMAAMPRRPASPSGGEHRKPRPRKRFVDFQTLSFRGCCGCVCLSLATREALQRQESLVRWLSVFGFVEFLRRGSEGEGESAVAFAVRAAEGVRCRLQKTLEGMARHTHKSPSAKATSPPPVGGRTLSLASTAGSFSSAAVLPARSLSISSVGGASTTASAKASSGVVSQEKKAALKRSPVSKSTSQEVSHAASGGGALLRKVSSPSAASSPSAPLQPKPVSGQLAPSPPGPASPSRRKSAGGEAFRGAAGSLAEAKKSASRSQRQQPLAPRPPQSLPASPPSAVSNNKVLPAKALRPEAKVSAPRERRLASPSSAKARSSETSAASSPPKLLPSAFKGERREASPPGVSAGCLRSSPPIPSEKASVLAPLSPGVFSAKFPTAASRISTSESAAKPPAASLLGSGSPLAASDFSKRPTLVRPSANAASQNASPTKGAPGRSSPVSSSAVQRSFHQQHSSATSPAGTASSGSPPRLKPRPSPTSSCQRRASAVGSQKRSADKPTNAAIQEELNEKEVPLLLPLGRRAPSSALLSVQVTNEAQRGALQDTAPSKIASLTAVASWAHLESGSGAASATETASETQRSALCPVSPQASVRLPPAKKSFASKITGLFRRSTGSKTNLGS